MWLCPQEWEWPESTSRFCGVCLFPRAEHITHDLAPGYGYSPIVSFDLTEPIDQPVEFTFQLCGRVEHVAADTQGTQNTFCRDLVRTRYQFITTGVEVE